MADPNPDDLLELLRRAIPAGAFLDRRLGRALAFQALYEMDVAHHQPYRSVERLGHAESPGGYTPETLAAATAFAQTLIGGVLDHRTEIDALIHERAPLWPLAQMSAIDRNVLRIGLYESLYSETSVPLRAAINEAVELAKAFGSETSAKFVNGVLGRAVETSVAEIGSDPTPEDRIAPDHRVGHNAPAMSETERTVNTEDNAGADQAPDRPAEERGSLHGHEL